MRDGREKFECCICLNPTHYPGCNPYPFGQAGDRCCEDCDDRFVVPVRILLGNKPLNSKLEQFLRALAKYGNFVIAGKRQLVKKRRINIE